ncbi:MAG: 4Fe-4S binding protein, partial [Defluviitaleaceae bacterium]|nr:4Fe-4S binding protein [Defluviitaleaceae bacterium]
MAVVKKRGFSSVSRILGKIQGKSWQGDSKNAHAAEGTMEHKAKNGVQIDTDCNACGLCVNICPMKNLETDGEKISHKNNCTV